MQIKTKYITAADFKTYFGIDLALELDNGANPSDKVSAFLKRIENRMEAYLNTYYFENINSLYPDFTDYQKEHYSLALLEQALYVFKNGDISSDSGYSIDSGESASNATIIEKSIAPNARQELILCGLCSRAIYKGNGYGSGFIPF